MTARSAPRPRARRARDRPRADRRGGRDPVPSDLPRSFAGCRDRDGGRSRRAPRLRAKPADAPRARAVATPIKGGAVAERDQLGQAIIRPFGRDAGEQTAGSLRIDQQCSESRIGIGLLRGERGQGGGVAAVQRAGQTAGQQVPRAVERRDRLRDRAAPPCRRRSASRSDVRAIRTRSRRCRRSRRARRGTTTRPRRIAASPRAPPHSSGPWRARASRRRE